MCPPLSPRIITPHLAREENGGGRVGNERRSRGVGVVRRMVVWIPEFTHNAFRSKTIGTINVQLSPRIHDTQRKLLLKAQRGV